MSDAKSIEHLVFDSDGVLTSGGKPLPGARELIQHLNDLDFPYHILTNNPFLDGELKSAGYRHIGYDIPPHKIVGAADPLPRWLSEHELSSHTVYSHGIEDPSDHLARHGLRVNNGAPYHELGAVILFDHDYDWNGERVADLLHIFLHRPELPFVVANPDLVYPDQLGHLMLTTGAWVQMLIHLCQAKGVELKPIFLGKPYPPIYQHLASKLSHSIPPEHVFMIGDSPGTDILGANRQGWSSILVETGNHRFGEHLEGSLAHYRMDNLITFRDQLDQGLFQLM